MNDFNRIIYTEIEVDADLKTVWDLWTTEDGIKSFFAPDCSIDLRPDGKYELYFDLDSPKGKRGGEGVRVMAIQPMKMFSFSWNAPPHLAEVRNQRTHVLIRFYPQKNGTKITLTHDGWGSGGQWDKAYNYFQKAWVEIVLPRLKHRLVKGPVDWNNPPKITG